MVLLRLIFLFAAMVVLSVPPDVAAGDKDKDNNASHLQAAERFAKSDIVEQKNCMTCHTIGTSGGTVGPILNQVSNRRPLDWLRQWLKDPNATKPGTKMPNFQFNGAKPEKISPDGEAPPFACPPWKAALNDTEWADLLAYLESIAPGRNGENTTPAPLSSYRVIAVENGGSITGVVRFESQFPRPERIRVSKDNEVCGAHQPAETFLVSPENKGLQNVLVTVEGVSAGRASAPATEITLEQKGCAYVPHFQVAEIGTEGVTLKVINHDGILHNIHSYHGQATLFNVAQPKFKRELSQKLTNPGAIKVKCDVHDWLSAYIVLLKDQPYYAVTDERGQFTIAGVPAGSYTLRAWHEALGTMEKPVTVAADQATEIDFIIKPKARK